MRLHTLWQVGVWTACCICGYHTAVGKLLVCKRKWKNAVGMYHGSKDRWFIGKLSRKLSRACHESAMWVLKSIVGKYPDLHHMRGTQLACLIEWKLCSITLLLHHRQVSALVLFRCIKAWFPNFRCYISGRIYKTVQNFDFKFSIVIVWALLHLWV